MLLEYACIQTQFCMIFYSRNHEPQDPSLTVEFTLLYDKIYILHAWSVGIAYLLSAHILVLIFIFLSSTPMFHALR